MTSSARPDPSEIPEFYHAYVRDTEGHDPLEALRRASECLRSVLKDVDEDKAMYRYAPGKWSIKEVVQHLIDSERIFAYRALRFARKDATPLPGFEENDYAPASEADRRTLGALLDELDAVRTCTLLMIGGFPPGVMERSGIANGRSISVRAICWVIAGHSDHHAAVLAERYLAQG